MKKSRSRVTSRNDDDILPEYDFSKGVRGKYARRYAQGTNIVILDPDVARAFPTSSSVNQALRALMSIAQAARLKTRRRKSA